jgi:hypothetical protein
MNSAKSSWYTALNVILIPAMSLLIPFDLIACAMHVPQTILANMVDDTLLGLSVVDMAPLAQYNQIILGKQFN